MQLYLSLVVLSLSASLSSALAEPTSPALISALGLRASTGGAVHKRQDGLPDYTIDEKCLSSNGCQAILPLMERCADGATDIHSGEVDQELTQKCACKAPGYADIISKWVTGIPVTSRTLTYALLY